MGRSTLTTKHEVIKMVLNWVLNWVLNRNPGLEPIDSTQITKIGRRKRRMERQITELESRLASIKKRLELMDEHAFASALHSSKSMGESLKAMEEKIQDMKVEVKSIGESLEEMEEKIQDMEVEGIENSRFSIEKSRKDAELMMKLKMFGEEKEERLTMRQRMAMPPDNGRLAASIDAKNQEIKLAMVDKPLIEIEKS